MDSMDFGLSESNMSHVNFSLQRGKHERSSTEKLSAASKFVSKEVTVEDVEDGEEDYSNDFS